MEEKEFRIRILLSTYRAMLGRITANMRIITIDWTEESYLLKAYYDTKVTEEDIENLEEWTAEVIADFPELNTAEELYEFSLNPMGELPRLKEVVFLRRE